MTHLYRSSHKTSLKVSSIAANTSLNSSITASSQNRLHELTRQFATTARSSANMANNNDSFKLETVFNVLVVVDGYAMCFI